MANINEWRRDFQRGKAARLNGEQNSPHASDAWRYGWRQQDAVMQSVTRPKTVVRPQMDEALARRRMMGSGRFVR